MRHKVQKRIYFEGAEYFLTFNTKDRINYFSEPIFCQLFIEVLRLAKKIRGFDLYAFVVLLNHSHLLLRPHHSEDLPKIMQFVKRHFTRNINFIMGFAHKHGKTEEAIGQSLLQIDGRYKQFENDIKYLNDTVIFLKNKFSQKHKSNPFPKFRWQKSYRDHYIRNEKDFAEHLRYIYENPIKHKIPDAKNYQYIFTNYPELIIEI